MKIGIISDLHIKNHKTFLKVFQKQIIQKKIELLLIGGDICDNCYDTIAFVNEINKVVKTKYIVGNHDMWNRVNGLSTSEIIEIYKNDPNCLYNDTIEIGDFKIIGSTAWYDYSYADNQKYSIDDFKRKSLKGITWQDKYYIDIEDDIQKSSIDLNFIEQEIDNSDKKIILITHIVNHENFLARSKNINWSYFNAYIGNKNLYSLTKNEKVKYAICGHVHFRYSFIEDGTEYICACLGNKKEYKYFLTTDDLAKNINHALKTIEI